MSVPDNIRTQFSTATINTNVNETEELNKESAYADNPYIPIADERATNPIKVIKSLEGAVKESVEDDSTELGELKKAIQELQADINNRDLSSKSYNHFILKSTTEDSTKEFSITVDDAGTISATEIV